MMTTWLLPPKSGAIFQTPSRNIIAGTLGVPVSFEDSDVANALAQGWTVSSTAPLEQLGKLIPVESQFIPETNDFAGILKAYNQALLAGGGIVKLNPITYNIGGNSLPMTGGVHYEGSGFYFNSSNGSLTGTVLEGNGTAPCFTDFKTDAGSSFADGNLYRADITVHGGSITGIGLKNFTFAVKTGALFRPGVWQYKISDCFIQSCSQWAMWCENSSLSNFSNIYVQGLGFVNGMFFGCSSGTAYNNTNNHYENITFDTTAGGIRSRYLVMGCRAPNTAVNDTVMQNIHVNSGSNLLTVTGTPAGGASTNISVPDSSVFALDMPVFVNATVNGLNAFVTYFVTFASGNIIRLANNPGGTPITFAAVTALPLRCFGFPHIEFATSFQGSDLTGCQIQPFTISGLDLEARATTSIVVVNGTGYIQHGTSNGQAQDVSLASNYCFRNSAVVLINASPSIYDFDGNAAAQSMLYGYAFDNGSNTPFPNATPQGFVRSFGRSTMLLNLATRGLGANARINGLAGVNPSGGNFIYPYGSIGQSVQVSTSTSLGMFGTHLGAIAFTGTANATWTLPTLSGSIGSNSYFGGVFEIANASTTGGVVLTLNSAVGQGFNRQAKTSYSLALGTSISVRAMSDGGTDFWWLVTGNNGAV